MQIKKHDKSYIVKLEDGSSWRIWPGNKMRQRGRKSATNVIQLGAARQRVFPPDYLTATERDLFNKVVTSCHPDHFVPSDFPIIVSYVDALLLARQYRKDTKRWQAVVRVQAMLARALRLTPRTRLGPRAARRNVQPTPLPWERAIHDP